MKHLLSLALLLFVSCQKSDQPTSPQTPQAETPKAETEAPAEEQKDLPFPILASRDWSATIDEADGKRTLRIEGEVDLPNPGYKIEWSLGPMDRMNPPGLRIALKAPAPDGITIQVVTPTKIKIETPATVPTYRGIIIHLDGKEVATVRPE